MLLPRTCSLCGRAGLSPCHSCAAQLRPAPTLPAPSAVDDCSALLVYEDAGREFIARLKYRNARSAVRWLVVSMAALVRHRRFDVVVWVPTTGARRHQRGFDQAELLARGVARQLHVPCRRLLVRGGGPPQTGRTLDERRVGPVLTVRARARVPARVLLVDDVVTTGTTVTRAARALRTAGAQHVSVVAAARTPLKRARGSSDNEVDGDVAARRA